MSSTLRALADSLATGLIAARATGAFMRWVIARTLAMEW